MKKMQFVCVMLVIATAGISQAAPTYVYDNSSPYETTGLTSDLTTGALMDGMAVTVYGAFGSETKYWADTGANSGGVLGTSYSWSLDQSGNTKVSTNYWELSVDAANPITSLLIDAGAGNTVFDVVSSPDLTTGSSGGLIFTPEAGWDIDAWTVTYSGPVKLTTVPFAGDLYRYMLLTPDAPWNGEHKFSADTDNADSAITAVVPAPGALLLGALGSGLVGFFRRRQWA